MLDTAIQLYSNIQSKSYQLVKHEISVGHNARSSVIEFPFKFINPNNPPSLYYISAGFR
jgi:hypothetical protein